MAAKQEEVGLCASCECCRRITSDRGSIFYECRRSRIDPAYPRYPRLPVLRCAGYDNAASSGQAATDASKPS